MACKRITAGVMAVGICALFAGSPVSGEKLFKAYCWGCHHQTAEAFGPSFRSIANQRTPEQIMAQIVDPESVSKTLGYRRNSMPAFNDLNATQIKALTDFIISFKDKK